MECEILMRVGQARGWTRPCHRPSPKYRVLGSKKPPDTRQSSPGQVTNQLILACSPLQLPGARRRDEGETGYRMYFSPPPSPGPALKLLHPPALPS